MSLVSAVTLLYDANHGTLLRFLFRYVKKLCEAESLNLSVFKKIYILCRYLPIVYLNYYVPNVEFYRNTRYTSYVYNLDSRMIGHNLLQLQASFSVFCGHHLHGGDGAVCTAGRLRRQTPVAPPVSPCRQGVSHHVQGAVSAPRAAPGHPKLQTS